MPTDNSDQIEPTQISSDPSLPSVSGSFDTSIADLERRCLVHLGEEQRKIAPDNALISTLCDAVRLCREYGSVMDTIRG